MTLYRFLEFGGLHSLKTQLSYNPASQIETHAIWGCSFWLMALPYLGPTGKTEESQRLGTMSLNRHQFTDKTETSKSKHRPYGLTVLRGMSQQLVDPGETKQSHRRRRKRRGGREREEGRGRGGEEEEQQEKREDSFICFPGSWESLSTETVLCVSVALSS